MNLVHSLKSMNAICNQWREKGQTIALVPTMGALHAGHLALINAAHNKADKVVVSIFVNPTQFGQNEDFDSYPRVLKDDLHSCKQNDVDVVFAPSVSAMYPDDFSTWVNEEKLSSFLCGARRKGHFRGVCTVVLKLFMICNPHVAVFGWKDAQQVLIIKKMVRDMNIPVKITTVSIKREKDGLAMSSRNQHLSPVERKQATVMHRGLQQIKIWRRTGLSAAQTRRKLMRFIQMETLARIDYVSIVDMETLTDVSQPFKGQKLIVAVAVFFNKTRLIDNIQFIW